MLLSFAALLAATLNLTTVADALGTEAERAGFEAIFTRAEVREPNGNSVTEIVSLRSGSVRMAQIRPEDRREFIVQDQTVLARTAADGLLKTAPSAMASMVRGHDVHRMLLELDSWFEATGKTDENGCQVLIPSGKRLPADGRLWHLCLDHRTGLPESIEHPVPAEVGGGTVRLELAAWSEVHGVLLPTEVTFVHGEDRFDYRYIDLLPFRLAPGTPAPADPAILHDRLADLAQIAELHHQGMLAHLNSDVDALLAGSAAVSTYSGGGRLGEVTREQMRQRFEGYLGATRFSRYEDTAVPVISVSTDGTLGWLACQMEAAGTQIDDGGNQTDLAFAFSWVELVAKHEGTWERIGNASSRRPNESCAGQVESVDRIRQERVTGDLGTAEAMAQAALECSDLESAIRVAVRIELAKTLDRFGLHLNTRPVAEALELLQQALDDSDPADDRVQADLALAFAGLEYRAEMKERRFERSMRQAQRAEELFRSLGDAAGLADAVHRLGLIELQKGNLAEARELFDQSLELSLRAERRPFFISDYHRHVAIIDLRQDNLGAAIEHLEASLRLRQEGGSRDLAMFAAALLGAVLVDADRLGEAQVHLESALKTARELPSPVAELRATQAMGELHEKRGATDAAGAAYEDALAMAEELGVAGFEEAARESLRRLGEVKETQP